MAGTHPEVLQGILVVELGTMVTAPLAGMLLGDMGARVIKVELPGTGDPFRGHGGGLYSPPFVAYNRGKESLQLDLRSDEGRGDLARLLASADVVIENFRPGVMERMGFDAARLAELNPRLIRASITGFGKDGPYQSRPSYDSVTMALSGMASLLLDRQDPHVTGPTIADNITGMYAAQGVLGALVRRADTGLGGHVEVNMLEASISFVPDAFAQYHRADVVSTPNTRVAISQSYALVCGDGRLVALHMSSVDKFWRGLLSVIGRPELAEDERFATPAGRRANYAALRSILSGIFLGQDRADWIAALAEAEVPAAPVHDIDEVANDPQVRHLGTFAFSEHPAMGKVTGIKSPITIDAERREELVPPPVLGADSKALAQEFGLTSVA